MGSIFGDPVLTPYSPPKRYIPKNTKHEESIQKQVCKYLRLQYPDVIFRSDYASGLRLTQNQARQHASMQSGRGWPDLFIYEPRSVTLPDGTVKFYAGLALELKKDKTSVWLKTGPRKGKLSTDKHIQEQAVMLRNLVNKGYYANFAVGYDQAIKFIDWYMGRQTQLNTELF